MTRVYIPKNNGSARRKAHPRPYTAPNPCKHCGGPITTEGTASAVKGRKYCKPECRSAYDRARPRTCTVCKLVKTRDQFALLRMYFSSSACLACREAQALQRKARPRGYAQLHAQASKRGISVTLTVEQWATFKQLPCYWCATPADSHVRLDRIDPFGIYEMGNLIAACFVCNRARGQLTMQEWEQHVAAIARNRPAEPKPYEPGIRGHLMKRVRTFEPNSPLRIRRKPKKP